MNDALKLVAALLSCVTMCAFSRAEEPGCSEISKIARVASARSRSKLQAAERSAGDSYRVQVAFAARALEIDPRNKSAAASLLDLTPKDVDDTRQAVWLELADLEQCKSGGIPDSDLKPLFRLSSHLPRLLANAVLLAPDRMLTYISYAYVSVQSPESDYAVQMRKVCRTRHNEFVSAVGELAPMDRDWFVSKIFNPEGCRPIALPEL